MQSISSPGVGSSPRALSEGDGRGAERRIVLLLALVAGDSCAREGGWWARDRDSDGFGGMNLLWCWWSIGERAPGETVACSLEMECCRLMGI
jgi:hypothetical protein